jgi:CspA family cold shock protein
MATGTVKWFNGTKGFGFIQPDAGGPDVFVHISAVERAEMRDLNEGQKIAYEIVADKRCGKSSADNLKGGLKLASPSRRRSDAISVPELAHMRSTGTEHKGVIMESSRKSTLSRAQFVGGPAEIDSVP